MQSLSTAYPISSSTSARAIEGCRSSGELHGKSQPVLITPPGGDEILIGPGQGVAAREVVAVGRHAEQRAALVLGQ